MKNNINNNYEIIIIGGGPAGITASIYLARANVKTLIIEKSAPGGKLIKTSEIENYTGYEKISGPDLAIKMYEHANKYKVPFVFSEITKLEKKANEFYSYAKNGNTYKSKSVIIATGTKERTIGAKGEKEFFGKGVSYCAVCDGAIYKNKDVAVIGGGLAAVEESMYLTNFVKKVYLIHRRKEFRVDSQTLNRARKNPKIVWILDSILEEVKGDALVNSIKIKNVKTNKITDYNVSALFPYIGSDPITSFIEIDHLLDKNKYISKNDKCESKIKGLFVAGDVSDTSLRQITTAVSDGSKAAQFAISYLDLLK